MVLLDAGKFTAYCRWCWWSSPSSGSLGDAHRHSPAIGARHGLHGSAGVRSAAGSASAVCGQPGRAGPRTAVKMWRCHDWATCRRRAR